MVLMLYIVVYALICMFILFPDTCTLHFLNGVKNCNEYLRNMISFELFLFCLNLLQQKEEAAQVELTIAQDHTIPPKSAKKGGVFFFV